MIRSHRNFLGRILHFWDLILVAVAWLGAYFVRFYVDLIPVTKGIPEFKEYAISLLFILPIWSLVLQASGQYRLQRLTSRTDSLVNLLKASFYSIPLFVTGFYLFEEQDYSRGVIVLFGIFSVTLLSLFRLGLLTFLRSFRKWGYNRRFVLLIGERLCVKVIKRIRKHSELGLHIIGRIGFTAADEGQGEIPYLGDISKMSEIFATLKRSQTKPDQIIVAISAEEMGYTQKIVEYFRDGLIDVKIIFDFFDTKALDYSIESFEGLPMISVNTTRIDRWNALVKRLMDLSLGSILFLLSLPVFIVIALLVKVTSKGPVFYRQERIGLDGRIFQMIKFRTMPVNVEVHTGAVWAVKQDSRCTPLGKILRRLSLDELPQFINVVKGEMSLVGPRPERPVFVDQFRHNIPGYMLRHKVKAGITGWAQINGLRGNTDLEKRLQYDLYYINNWSPIFDLKIIFFTLFKGPLNKNAY